MKRYHVEDPQDPMNELVCYEEDLGSYTVLATKVAPPKNVNIAWKMNFDGAKSRMGTSAEIVFTSPRGDTLCYAFCLRI
jgi:hypothetical protein